MNQKDELERLIISKKQLREDEVARIMDVSRDKLRHDRVIHVGPPFRRFGRVIRYDLEELLKWMKNQSTGRD